MPRVIAYARVSTERQDLENQMFEVNRYLERHHMTLDEVVEEKVSGRKQIGDRVLGSLLARLDEGDTLIVAEVSRLSRRLNEVFSVVQALIERKVTLISVKQNYKFGIGIESKVIAFAFGLAAEIERDLISARTKEALARKKAEGVILGRPVGSTNAENLKLFGRDEEIMDHLAKRVPVTVMARLYGVNPKTLRAYIDRFGLDDQVHLRHIKKIKEELHGTGNTNYAISNILQQGKAKVVDKA